MNESSTLSLLIDWMKQISHLEMAKNKSLCELRMNQYHEQCSLQKEIIFNVTRSMANLNSDELSHHPKLLKQLTKLIKNVKDNLSQEKLLLDETQSILEISKKKLLNQHYNDKGEVNSELKYLHALNIKV